MHIEYLRTFCRVVERGSFTRAGRDLNLSQPAVSLQIRALEEQLGGSLLVRRNQRTLPTELGEEVYRRAREILRGFDALTESARRITRSAGPRVRVEVGFHAGLDLLAPATAWFWRDAPEAQLTVRLARSGQLAMRLQQGHADLGLTLIVRPGGDPRLVEQFTWPERVVLAVRPDHPLAEAHSCHASQLPSIPVVLPPEGSEMRRLIDERLAGAGVRLGPTLCLSGPQGIRSAALEGGFAAFQLGRSVEADLRAGRLKAVDLRGVDLSCTIALCRAAGRPLGETPLQFLKAVRHTYPEALPGADLLSSSGS